MNKLTIVGLESGASGLTVEVQFNPKEIAVDKSIPWKQKTTGPGDLAFVSADPQTMSCELLFDASQSGGPIQDEIDKLQRLSDIDQALKRPPKVKVVWGAEGAPGMMPKFEAVVESMGIRYTMFDGNGMPLKATVRIGFKQARHLKVVPPQ